MKKVFITSEIKTVHGGLTASLLNKARILSQEMNEEILILTFNFDANYPDVIENIRERYQLDNRVKIINMNQHYCRKLSNNHQVKRAIFDASALVNGRPSGKKLTYYENDKLRVKRSVIDNRVLQDEFFTDSKRLYEKWIYDTDGCIAMRSFYQEGSTKVHRQIIYRPDGKAIIERLFEKDKIQKLRLFQEDDNIRNFESIEAFKTAFILEEIVKTEPTIIVSETRSQDRLLLDMKQSYIKKVFMTHSIHIRPETDIIRAGNRVVMGALNQIDGVVFLTKQQKKDVQHRFGNRSNYFVIPHSIKLTSESLPIKERTSAVVILSRLHQEKRLEDAITAFKEVVIREPKATLHIYGDGPERKKLQLLIKDLQLEAAVFLEGHTNEPKKVLQTADFSVLTSLYEGFGMVIQESLAVGTPVIAYDIKYGPADMIDNGSNGYLVQNGNIVDLAKRMVEMMELDKSTYEQMRVKALEKMNAFSEKMFVMNWVTLFNQVTDMQLSPITDVAFKLEKVKRTRRGYLLSCTVEVTSEQPVQLEALLFEASFYLRSTLSNKETAKYTSVPIEVRKRQDDKIELLFPFDFANKQAGETYDLFVAANASQFYQRHRVGNVRSRLIPTKFMWRFKGHAYFTEYGNLSFKIR